MTILMPPGCVHTSARSTMTRTVSAEAGAATPTIRTSKRTIRRKDMARIMSYALCHPLTAFEIPDKGRCETRSPNYSMQRRPIRGTRVAQRAPMNRRGFLHQRLSDCVAGGAWLAARGLWRKPDIAERLATATQNRQWHGRRQRVTVAIAADSPLAAVGGAALVQSNSGAFLVARVGQDTFNAMTAVCTHEQCTVNEFGNSMFQCPCHGSQYSTSGSVVRGPASQSLRRFKTTFAGNILTIALS